ncbi:hypothetical protein [Amycolatopsis sp. NPDC098790]|uniref:hypothetical protein n=1 Tax=Amycolatopsis sp. NPDC098790 TaxID=3363939 RepID=UPI0037FD84AE
MTFLRLDIPDRTAHGRSARPRVDSGCSLRGQVLALQRAAGNAATTRALRAVPVQRSIVDEVAVMKPDDLAAALSDLNPKAAATNLWVTVDGVRVKDLMATPATMESLWPIQSGRGPHAEERFTTVVMPLLAARQPKHILLEINKSPCPGCTALLAKLADDHPGTKFELHMLGLYPGGDGTAEGERGAATRSQDLVVLEQKLQAKLLDLQAVVDRLSDERWKKKLKLKHTKIPFNARVAALQFVRSVQSTMSEGRQKLGASQDQTAYGSKLKDLEATFERLATFLTSARVGDKKPAHYEPYHKRDNKKEKPTDVTETVHDLDRWNEIKEQYADLQLQHETYGEYFIYWSQTASTWFYAHQSLPE